MVLTWSFTKLISLFRMQRPKVKMSTSRINGPTKVETRVESQGDLLNQTSNQFSCASLSLFLLANHSLTLAMDFFTTP